MHFPALAMCMGSELPIPGGVQAEILIVQDLLTQMDVLLVWECRGAQTDALPS